MMAAATRASQPLSRLAHRPCCCYTWRRIAESAEGEGGAGRGLAYPPSCMVQVLFFCWSLALGLGLGLGRTQRLTESSVCHWQSSANPGCTNVYRQLQLGDPIGRT